MAETTETLPEGYECKECGKSHQFPAYVFAHWRDSLEHTCECGARYSIRCGKARRIEPRPT